MECNAVRPGRLMRRVASKRTRQDKLIPGHIMFKAGDPRVVVMPEAFAIPRLVRELVPALLWKDQLNQRLQPCREYRGTSFAITDPSEVSGVL